MEVTKAVVEVWGADRVGVRLSPYGVANGSGEPDPMPLYTYAVEQLNPLGLAYLHFIEPRSSGAGRARGQPSERAVGDGAVPPDLEGRADHSRRLLRRDWRMRRSGMAMRTRLRSAASSSPIRTCRAACSASFPLTPYNRATFYGGDVAGYTDYPEHNELEQA